MQAISSVSHLEASLTSVLPASSCLSMSFMTNFVKGIWILPASDAFYRVQQVDGEKFAAKGTAGSVGGSMKSKRGLPSLFLPAVPVPLSLLSLSPKKGAKMAFPAA